MIITITAADLTLEILTIFGNSRSLITDRIRQKPASCSQLLAVNRSYQLAIYADTCSFRRMKMLSLADSVFPVDLVSNENPVK